MSEQPLEQKEEQQTPGEIVVRVHYLHLSWQPMRHRQTVAPVVWANRSQVELQLPEEASGQRLRFNRRTGVGYCRDTKWGFHIEPEDLRLLPKATLRKHAPKLVRVEFAEPRPSLLVSYARRSDKLFSKARWTLLRLEHHQVVVLRPDDLGGGEVTFYKSDGSDVDWPRDEDWFFSLHILDATTLGFIRTSLADFGKRWNYRTTRLEPERVCVRFQEQLGNGVALEGELHLEIVKRSKTTLSARMPDGTAKKFSLKSGRELSAKKDAVIRYAVLSDETVLVGEYLKARLAEARLKNL
jgi:hypothetical protein